MPQPETQYPNNKYLNDSDSYLQIKSLTYNTPFYFLPYNLKITENLTPEWNSQTVIGRMDPISNFKRMGRAMSISFQARARNSNNPPYLTLDELLHTIDHLKGTLYPRYNNQVMVSPPLFRIKYGNLICAGETTDAKGVLCYITSFNANPVMDVNKVAVVSKNFYPKVFDVSIGFTVLNENLMDSYNKQGILNKRYFYSYDTPYHEQENISDTNKQSDKPKDSSTPDTPEEAAFKEAALLGK